jgi:hypothetical protein
MGWERLAFLDDDVEVGDPDDLRRAAGLLDAYDAVGLDIGGFPDNSVVCHAKRLVEKDQDTFVGAGALVVHGRVDSFFPCIYNEDWFFLLNDAKLRSVAMTGHARQRPYDPFANPNRARNEEFGDVLAEGVFWLLDTGKRVRDADKAFWEAFIADRRQLIERVRWQAQARVHDPDERKRMDCSLDAALTSLNAIEPGFCVDYLAKWRGDRTRWRKTLVRLRVPFAGELDAESALRMLGIVPTGPSAAPAAAPSSVPAAPRLSPATMPLRLRRADPNKPAADRHRVRSRRSGRDG